MHESYWGLRESPFRRERRIRYYFPSPTHEEALARLEFLVAARRRLATLSGCEGSGRTTTLELFSRQQRQRGQMACLLNLLGIDQRSFLWELAAGLGANPRTTADCFTLNRQIQDRLRENDLQGISTALLLDDADQAENEVLMQVLRLVKTAPDGITVLLALEPARFVRLGGDLLQLSQLRIHLESWEASDVQEYLQASLAQAGCTRRVFDESAARRLRELTDGIPRWVSELADLALVAAADQKRERIDGDVIESVYRELSAAYEEGLAATV
jgi:general secretion pathway protein A